MCGSYKLLYWLLNCEWACFWGTYISWPRSAPADRAQQHLRDRYRSRAAMLSQKTDISAPFRQRIARFSTASISIANMNWPRSFLLPHGKFNWVRLPFLSLISSRQVDDSLKEDLELRGERECLIPSIQMNN